jgi:hypothetical protein
MVAILANQADVDVDAGCCSPYGRRGRIEAVEVPGVDRHQLWLWTLPQSSFLADSFLAFVAVAVVAAAAVERRKSPCCSNP